MKFVDNLTMDDLKKMGKPTFNECEHYLIQPQQDTMQTIVIELEGGKHMTVCIMPDSDTVDVKVHGEHKSVAFNGTHIHAFYGIKEGYNG